MRKLCCCLGSLAFAAILVAVPAAAQPHFTEQAQLVPRDENGPSNFGASVTISENGNIAVIGGPEDNGGVGAAWVFKRKGSIWIQQGPKLIGPGEVGQGRFGDSVDVSPDGSTVLIGAPEDDKSVGAAWVFRRIDAIWAEQGGKLTGVGESGQAHFGASVALSYDGDTALIGGPADAVPTESCCAGAGAAWTFSRSGSTWFQQGPKLTGGEEEGPGEFGASVALSAKGSTALIGGPEDDFIGGHGCSRVFTCAGGPVGAAWVFTRAGVSWGQQGRKLVPPSPSALGVEFGQSVALSAAGETALIGSPGYGFPNPPVGAAWAFTQAKPTWNLRAKLINGEPKEEEGLFAHSVAFSARTGIALIGNGVNAGAVVFTRAGASWIQQKPTLTCHVKNCSNVALSGDGQTALLGPVVFRNHSQRRSRPSGGRTGAGRHVGIHYRRIRTRRA